MRWVRNIFALIAFAFLTLWVLSHVYIVELGAPWQNGSTLTFSSYVGYTSLGISYGGVPNRPSHTWHAAAWSVSEMRQNFEMMNDLGIDMKSPEELVTYGYKSFSFSDPGGKWTWSGADFTIPTWLPTLLFALWPAIALMRHIKRRYFTPGVCRKCGYDLRGTPSGTCPECGFQAKSGGRETI